MSFPGTISELCVFLLLVSLVNADQLQSALEATGIRILFPENEGYIDASTPCLAISSISFYVYTDNRRYTVAPDAIAYPSSETDVTTLIILGHTHNVNVVAKSGGHSYIANSLGGKNGSLVVDLSEMKSIQYDPNTGIATVETGNLLGDVALALSEYDRGLPHGRCTYVGIGGHAGRRGFGYMSRMWGLTLDTLVSANLVLANGTIANASNETNVDLFWAIRGSSSSFAIVTSMMFQTFAVPVQTTIFQYFWTLDVETSITAFIEWQNFSLSKIPLEFGGELGILAGPEENTLTIALLGGFYGASEDFNPTIVPFMDRLPTPDVVNVTTGDWVTGLWADAAGSLNTSDGPDAHDTLYAKSMMSPEDTPLTVDAITALMNYLGTQWNYPGIWHIEVELFGGDGSVINSVSSTATAFAHKNSLFSFQFYTSSSDNNPPFPADGFNLLDSMYTIITSKMPIDWNYAPAFIQSRQDAN